MDVKSNEYTYTIMAGRETCGNKPQEERSTKLETSLPECWEGELEEDPGGDSAGDEDLESSRSSNWSVNLPPNLASGIRRSISLSFSLVPIFSSHEIHSWSASINVIHALFPICLGISCINVPKL